MVIGSTQDIPLTGFSDPGGDAAGIAPPFEEQGSKSGTIRRTVASPRRMSEPADRPLQLSFLGVRGTAPKPEATSKYGGNTTCLAVDLAPHHHLVVDCGTGLRALGERLAARFDMGLVRSALGLCLGAVVGFIASGVLGVGLPGLPFIGTGFALVNLPHLRAGRKEIRETLYFLAVVAIVLAVVTCIQKLVAS